MDVETDTSNPFDLTDEQLAEYREAAIEYVDVGDEILIIDNVFIKRVGNGDDDDSFRVVADSPSSVEAVEETDRLYRALFVN